jgi:hypothetical protein
LIFVRLKLWAIGIGLVLAALAASWLGGRKAAQADAKQEEFEDYAETRRRMDEVGRMSDADAAHDWLRERGKH